MTYLNYSSTNNAASTIVGNIGAATLSIIVKTGEGALFPSTFPALLTLEHYDTIGENQVVTKREIVKLTNRVADVLTVTRSAGTCVQDDSANPKLQGTTAFSFDDGDSISNYYTNEQQKDSQDEITNKQLKAYDVIVDASGGGDYTTVGAALTANKVNIFVREGAYTEDVWDCSGADTAITCQSRSCVFTFSNTNAHSASYIISNSSFDLAITNGAFTVTLNGTNTRMFGGSSVIGVLWQVRNIYVNLSTDDVSGRYMLNGPATDHQNGFFDCEFELTNAANTQYVRLAQSKTGFHNCYILNGRVYINYSLFEKCHFHGITYLNCNQTVLKGTTIDTGIIEGTITDMSDSVANSTTSGTLTLAGAVHSRIRTIGDLTLNAANGAYQGIGYSNCDFKCTGDITLNTKMSGCHIYSCANFFVNANNCLISGSRILVVTGLFFTSSGDYSAMTSSTTVNPNKTTIDAGCTGAVIVGCANMGSITDNGTSSVIANNS